MVTRVSMRWADRDVYKRQTYQNAVSLIKELGATLKEVRIEKAVRQHFADIGHDENNHDVTYENSQARERTQILMDMANQYNGMVIGTGDMSELALGWATYNGDHMSMYAVNCSVPKTLVRYLVLYYAETTDNKKLSEVLMDVLDLSLIHIYRDHRSWNWNSGCEESDGTNVYDKTRRREDRNGIFFYGGFYG